MKVLSEAPQAAEPLLAATGGIYANRADAEDFFGGLKDK